MVLGKRVAIFGLEWVPNSAHREGQIISGHWSEFYFTFPIPVTHSSMGK